VHAGQREQNHAFLLPRRALGKPVFQGFALSLSATDEADADRLFNALANGGQVQMPLVKTFFSPRFGMVADRFGVGWMVIALPPDVREFVISRVFDAPRELLWISRNPTT
jgi:uncharacterized glyoxalase superfamily protein PhnB